MEDLNDLGLTDVNDGCSCCGHASEVSTPDATRSTAPVHTDYLVSGMTCSHCVASVTEEVSALEGVESVSVDLVASGASCVRINSAEALDVSLVRTAIEEAGYELAGPNG
ncbi:heavy-metal-associated domain-containing protein [Cryobacterium tepidiphilum]|jgi:copper chaperone CopZ|uniref:Copper chaperone n=1 Tax=Cryobacterium tepidiphilum TaxID=2486026 RepID=A0A3M8L1D6_9MICO|nr:heavy-metal-associated domain-containing protein [Cryobacterium tepidiphilum]RNE59350.1 copper chaperone [Cryobacterium tepidiphilum]